MRPDYQKRQERQERLAKLDEIFSNVSFSMLLRLYSLNSPASLVQFMDMLSELYPAYRELDICTKEAIREYLQDHYDIDIDYPNYEAIIWLGD